MSSAPERAIPRATPKGVAHANIKTSQRQSLKKILGEKMTLKWNLIDLKSDLLEVMKKHKITNQFTFEPRQLPKFDDVFKQWNEAQKYDSKFAHEL